MKKSVVASVVLGASVVFGAAKAVHAATSQSISTATPSGWTVSAGAALGMSPLLSGGDAISITSDGTAAGTPVAGLSLSTFDGFWIADYTFVLPPDATNLSISINNFFADDRSILKLNGNIIANTSVDGPGSGSMVEADGSAPVSFNFTNGSTGAAASVFVVGGTNTLEAVINNTTGGMAAPLADIGATNGTNFGLDGVVSYAVSIPLPASFGCGLLTMLAIACVGIRRRADSR
jgi:hypothetical protein